MDELKEIAKSDEIIIRRLKALKELGFDEEEIKIAMKSLIDPMNQLIDMSKNKVIEIKSPSNKNQSDA